VFVFASFGETLGCLSKDASMKKKIWDKEKQNGNTPTVLNPQIISDSVAVSDHNTAPSIGKTVHFGQEKVTFKGK
jgi:hypothetical protein